MILMMNKLMRWSGSVLAAAEAAVARLPQLFLPPPVFCITICKKALLLSVFAFMPSVFAADIPLATLSVDNIQVRAEWDVVGDDANHFRMDGNTLMLTSNISAVGKPDGVTITADVEVRDKFSTLNQNYQDLITRVKITTVIMGCHAYWTGRFAKSFRQEGKSPANQIVMEDSPIKAEDVIARRNNDNGYNNVFLHTVIAISPDTSFTIRDGIRYNYSYMTTSPDLFDYLKWDTGKAASQLGWMTLEVNESETCFAEEIETFQQQEKTQYLNANAPLISGTVTVAAYGVIAVEGRAVNVASAFPSADGNQVFYVNVSLGNILNELYPPKVIIDDGKAFSISGKYPIGNSYAYFANLTVGSDSVDKQSTHEVIVVGMNDCPPIYEVIAWREGDGLRISASDFDKAFDKAKKYMIINETIYPGVEAFYIGTSTIKGVESYLLITSDNQNLGLSLALADSDHLIKFVDHLLCGTG